jgi:hypothetical protein
MTQGSTEYELLVAELHQALINADGVTTVSVAHDKTIVGKSGAMHQIDVYWEFELGGAFYKTCIECKQFNSKIKKSHVAALSAVIDDIGGATGIFATTIGFQRGAILLAGHRNIRLVLVNPLLREINIHFKFAIPEIVVQSIEFDTEQVRSKLKELGLASYTIHEAFGDKTDFLDSTGRPSTTLGTLIRTQRHPDGSHVIETQDLYYQSDIGLLRLASIKYSIRHTHIESDDRIVSQDTAKAIWEDVAANTACYLHTDGSITQRET